MEGGKDIVSALWNPSCFSLAPKELGCGNRQVMGPKRRGGDLLWKELIKLWALSSLSLSLSPSLSLSLPLVLSLTLFLSHPVFCVSAVYLFLFSFCVPQYMSVLLCIYACLNSIQFNWLYWHVCIQYTIAKASLSLSLSYTHTHAHTYTQTHVHT